MKLKHLLVLLCCCMTTAKTTAQGTLPPEDGGTYYIRNMGQLTYLAADGERLTLAGHGMPIELKSTGNGLYELVTPKGSLSLSINSAVRCDGSGTYRRWAIIPVEGVPDSYRLACRTKEASAFFFLHHDPATGLPVTTPLMGDTDYGEAQWTLVTPADYEQNVITLDEASTAYTVPQGNITAVRLKRDITLDSWCTFCVPFDIDEEQLKREFGDDVRVAAYNGSTGTRMSFTTVKSIRKGVPYLLKKTKAAPAAGYYEFSVENGFCDRPENIKPEGGDMGFYGTFIKTTAPSGAYAMSKNVMYHLATDQELKGFRGYFFSDTPGGKEMTWTLDDTTVMENISISEDTTDGNACNTAGQLTGKGSAEGVIITKGNKTIRKQTYHERNL